MKRSVFLLVIALLLLTLQPVAQGQEGLSRGDFAAMLVKAGKMESELPPAEFLIQKGIMKGYPDGELYLDRAITRLEAVTLVAKALGAADVAAVPLKEKPSLSEEHWGYGFYSWLSRFGLADGNPEEILTEEEAKSFLESVFSTDSAVLSILEEAQERTKDIKTLRSVVSGSMHLIPRYSVEGTEEIPQTDFQMKAVQEMVLPDSMRQITTITLRLPGAGPQEIAMEMYIVDGKIYQQVPVDMETGEMQWLRYPEEMFPDLEQIFKAEEATSAVPAELEDYLSFKLLGTTQKNGEELYEIVTYGRIDDLNKFMQALAGQIGDNLQIQQLLQQGLEMIDSMSFWSIQYVGVQDYLTKSADMFFILNFAEEFAGAPNPIEAMQMRMVVEEYGYDEEFTIELPQEALNAPLLELPVTALD